MSVTGQSLLDAMDGIVLVLDHQLHIEQVGWPNWHQFLDDNPPQDAAAPSNSGRSVLDRSVTQFMASETLRATFAKLFQEVLNGTRTLVQVDYRCDSPTLRRDMRLTVRPIKTGGDVRHLLYQSVMLSLELRPAIQLFGAPVADGKADDILTLCAICARVAWPVGAPTGEREWIEPTEYYRRGGADVALISHGFCKACFDRLQDED